MSVLALPRAVASSVTALLLGLGAVTCSTPPASAMCVAQGTELVWSYPADGATDVPVDATIWVWGRELVVKRATLNGKRVGHEMVGFGGVRFEPGRLAPDADHVLVLEGTKGQEPVQISFRTGQDPFPMFEEWFEVKGYSTSGELPRDPFCSRVLEAQDCFDTGQDTLLTIYPTAIDARAWLMLPKPRSPGETIVWPVECGAPSVYLHGAILPTLCYEIHAIGPGGKLSEMATACGFGQQTTVTPCPDEATAPESFTPASILSKVEPLPTHIAWAVRLGGPVLVRATIDRSGAVVATETVSAPERLTTGESGATRTTTLGLDTHAMDQIRTWRFAPATRDGQPVDSTLCLRTEFVDPPEQREERIISIH